MDDKMIMDAIRSKMHGYRALGQMPASHRSPASHRRQAIDARDATRTSANWYLLMLDKLHSIFAATPGEERRSDLLDLAALCALMARADRKGGVL